MVPYSLFLTQFPNFSSGGNDRPDKRAGLPHRCLIRPGALPEYFATFQDVRAIRHAESFPDVMIGNEHANSRLCKVPDQFLEILHR